MLVHDLRYALRTLWRSPGFAVIAILSLALGIGANTSVFSLLDQVLLRMLPVRDPQQLVVLGYDGPSSGWRTSDNRETPFSQPVYERLTAAGSVFDGLIARASTPVSVFYNGQSERAAAEVVSGNFFEVLGVTPAIGRNLTPADDSRSANPVAVMSYEYWTRRFGANPEVLRQPVSINGHPFTITGVMPRGFRGIMTGNAPELFVPISAKILLAPDWKGAGNWRISWLQIIGRLKPGVARDAAQSQLQAAWRPVLEDALAQQNVSENLRNRARTSPLRLKPAEQGINLLSAAWKTPLLAMMTIVALVLLIACANVANLMLARAAGRRKEIAVRLAMGANTGRLLRLLVVESLTVALLAGVAALLVASWTSAGLLAFLPEDVGGRVLSSQIDYRILAFNFVLAIGTGILFGLVPAMQASQPDLVVALKAQAAAVRSEGGQSALRRALIIGQVAISLLLLVGAGLFTRSLDNLIHSSPGFQPERLVTFSIEPVLNGYDRPRTLSLQRELRERLASLPGAVSAGLETEGLFSESDRSSSISVEGYTPREDEDNVNLDAVSPDYFRTLGVPLLAGREFAETDQMETQQVAVVSQSFARYYFRDGSAIGRRMSMSRGNNVKLDIEIVGVVPDWNQQSLREKPRRFFYIPISQDQRLSYLSFYVRARQEEGSLLPQVRRLVASIDPGLPVSDLKPLMVQVASSIYTDRLIMALASAFGILATLLAAIGLYGVVAYNVARRTAELGIRAALGAQRRDLLWMVMREVALVTVCGMAIGLIPAYLLSRLVESQLFGVAAFDPLVYGGAILVLCLSATAAGLVPAQRAASIDPIKALRCD